MNALTILPDTEVKVVRSSGVALLDACGQSHKKPKIAIRQDNEPARLGSAVHEALANMVRGDKLQNFGELTMRYSIDVEELTKLYNFGRKGWRDNIAQYFGNDYKVEGQLLHQITPNLRLVGTPDVFALLPEHNEIRILDWKSGWKTDINVRPQMLSYALYRLRNIQRLSLRLLASGLRV